MDLNVSDMPWLSATPKNKIFRVQILLRGGTLIEKHVVARSEKEALVEVILKIPDTNSAWQAPGWDVQVFEARGAFIL